MGDRKGVWETGAIAFAAAGLLTLAWAIYPAIAIDPEPGSFGHWAIVSCSVLGGLELMASALFAGLWARCGKAKKEEVEDNGKGE